MYDSLLMDLWDFCVATFFPITGGYIILEGSATRVNFQVEAKCDEANGFLDASKEVQTNKRGLSIQTRKMMKP